MTEAVVDGTTRPRERSRSATLAAQWPLWLLVLVAAGLRFATLSTQSLWLDEWLTHNHSVGSLHDLASSVIDEEGHPPLYFGAVWLWSHVFGADEFGLRSFSALVGTITVPLTYVAARTRLSRRVALLAAAFVAVNPFSVWFSQEARPYALLEALCLASFICMIRFADGAGRRWVWAWAGAASLALLTHFFAGFLIVGEVVWLLWTRKSRELVLPIAAIGVVGLLLLVIVAKGGTSKVAWVHESAPLETRVFMVPVQFLTGLYTNWDDAGDTAVRFVAAAVLAAAGLMLALASARTRRAVRPFLVVAAALLLIPIAVALVKPSSDYVLPRYLIAAAVPLLIVVAAGLGSGRARKVGVVAGGVLVAVFLSMTISISVRHELERPDWRGVADAMGPAPVPRAVVTDVNVQGRPLTFYAPRLKEVYDSGSATFAGDRPEQGRVPVTVSQLVYVGPAAFGARSGRSVPEPGFRLTGRRTVGGFLVLTYSSARPFKTTAGELTRTAPRAYGYPLGDVTAASVYLQRPG